MTNASAGSGPSTAGLPRQVRRARLGVFGIFFVVGFVMAAWLVNIPAVQARVGISHGALGLLLLVLGLGGVIAMQISGVIIARVGSKAVTIAAVAFAVVAINLPALSSNVIALGVALFVFGLGNGAADVAMNDQAVVVEQRYGRPIMSAFHALWSIGGAVGALWGAACQALHVDVRLSVLTAAALSAILAIYFLRLLLDREPGPEPENREPAGTGPIAATGAGSIRWKMIAYGALAFLLMLAEGVANDWGPLHAVERLHQPESTASLAFGTFAVFMTVGRLTVDRVAHRFGPRFVVRFGSLMAALGIGLVVISPVYPLTVVGWAVYGVGLAGIVPQLFTAAGNLPSARPSVVLARVVGAGYVGMLAGPALIGAAAGRFGLGKAFIIPLVFCLVGVALAGSVSTRMPASPSAGSSAKAGPPIT